MDFDHVGHITCPHCGELMGLELCDGDGDLVTYWAEDGPVEKECPACEKTVWVQEHVQRWWTAEANSPDYPLQPDAAKALPDFKKSVDEGGYPVIWHVWCVSCDGWVTANGPAPWDCDCSKCGKRIRPREVI